MKNKTMKILPPDVCINSNVVAEEVGHFAEWRRSLISYFGVLDTGVARAAISLYRTTISQDLVQIHVRAVENPGDRVTNSFFISHEAQEKLWDGDRFLRWRYPSYEEGVGQYQNPLTPVLLRIWGKKNNVADAILYHTTTEIGGRIDSSSFVLIQRNQYGLWELKRAYRLECGPESRAWQLGTQTLTRAVLPGCKKLHVPDYELRLLTQNHIELLTGEGSNSFKHRVTNIVTGQQLLDWLASEHDYSHQGQEILAQKIDAMLTTM